MRAERGACRDSRVTQKPDVEGVEGKVGYVGQEVAIDDDARHVADGVAIVLDRTDNVVGECCS